MLTSSSLIYCRTDPGGGLRHLQEVREGDPEAADRESAHVQGGRRGQERSPLLGRDHQGVLGQLQSLWLSGRVGVCVAKPARD